MLLTSVGGLGLPLMKRRLDDRFPLAAASFFFFFLVEKGNAVRENSENRAKSGNIRASAKIRHSSCKLKSTNIFLLARMVSLLYGH